MVLVAEGRKYITENPTGGQACSKYDKNRVILITRSKTCTALVFLTLQIEEHLY